MVTFEPINLDDCENTSAAHYQQSSLMRSVADDISARNGDPQLVRAFRLYALYSLQQGHGWLWKELGDDRQSWAWHSMADRTYESMPEFAKWA